MNMLPEQARELADVLAQQDHDLRVKMLALLLGIQWAGHDVHYVCPKCSRDRTHGHDSGCMLQELIAYLSA